MAVIKPTLTLTSNASSATTDPGPLSIALSLSTTDSLTVDTVEAEIFTEGTGANTTILDGSALESAFVPGTNGCFIYLRNTMTSGTETICVGIVNQGTGAPAVDDGTDDLTRSHADSHRTFALLPGEFAFFPLYSGLVVQAEAYTAACVLEYAQYSNG